MKRNKGRGIDTKIKSMTWWRMERERGRRCKAKRKEG